MEGDLLPWEQERCEYQDDAGRCTGIRLGNDGNCLSHTTPHQRALALALFHAGADLNFTQGAPLTEELLAQILEQAPVEDGHPVLTNSDFSLTNFGGNALFGDAQFSGNTSFFQAKFSGGAWFGRAQFSENAWFDDAQFGGYARFDDAQFSGDVRFRGAQFSEGNSWNGSASYKGAQFGGGAQFDGAQFSGGTSFKGAQFSEITTFSNAQFGGSALFDGAQFRRDARFFDAQFSGDAKLYSVYYTGGTSWFASTSFDGTQFGGDATFKGAQFSRGVWFQGAKFSREAWFDDAQFSGGASFEGAQFSGGAWFGRAQSSREAWFDSAQFGGDAWFDDTQFIENAWFRGAQFSGHATFRGAKFSEDATFRGAQFSGDATFQGAQFSRGGWFDGAQFGGHASFQRATFENARKFGPSLAIDSFDFDEAYFFENINIEASAGELSCRGSKFREGANLRIRWADISLEEADFSSPCLVDGDHSQFDGLKEGVLVETKLRSRFLRETRGWEPERGSQLPSRWMEAALVTGLEAEVEFLQTIYNRLLKNLRQLQPDGRPRIVSVRRANCASLALADVDLQACRFAGAHKLDGLRIESKLQFAECPSGWHKQLGWPPVWKWTDRRALAEEHQWRRKYEHGIRQEDWYPEDCRPPAADDSDPLMSSDIQNLYRDLRRGREDTKDEPGAADFYYGEMEMRRFAAQASFERLVLWFYWLVSGYGLRASRALLALAVTVLLCSIAMNSWGLTNGDERDFAEILVFGLQSTTSFLRAPDVTLTLPGQVIQIALRLLGPLFFGLALLSLRGRVKR